jgi:hypothetical protein
MDTKLIALRNDLAARRDRLHEKAETIEAEILKLTEQIDTVNTLIHNMTGVRQQIPTPPEASPPVMSWKPLGATPEGSRPRKW